MTKQVTPSAEYLETLCRYYEEEVEGEAYFDALAERLDDPDHKEKMHLMARVENYAANAVVPLITKYGLTPISADKLARSGQEQARKDTRNWQELIAGMRKTFPGYIVEFEGLEALAPEGDLPPLKVLTAHEIAAIDFLEKEAAGDPASAAPMQRYLATGTA